MRPFAVPCIAGVALSILAAVAPSARADDSPSDIAAARALGTDGVMLADAGNCAEAIPKLERAEKLHHAPTTAVRLGECHIELGRLVLGTEILQRALREPAGPNRPQAFVDALARAQKALDQAQPKIATLHVVVRAPAGTKLSWTVDGERISDALLDADRPTDPGSHTVQATAPGFLPATATVRLTEGQRQSLELRLEPDPHAVVPASDAPTAHSTTPPKGATAADQGRPGSKVPGLVALGIGGVALVAGGVTGVLAAGRASSVHDACPNDRCVQGSAGERDLDAAKTFGNVSTVAFAVAGVALVTGGVLLLTSTPSHAPAHGRAAPRRDRALGLEPRLGIGFAGLGGTFQ